MKKDKEDKLEKAIHILMLKESFTWCDFCRQWRPTKEFVENKHGHENPSLNLAQDKL